MQWFLIGLAVIADLSNPIQSAVDAGLNKALGQLLPSVIIIYGVALVGLMVCSPFLAISLRGLGSKATGAPWWVWIGGLCNLIFVLAAATATQKVGSAVYTVIVACCAIVLSILLDRFGVLGLKPHPLTVWRLAGGAMAMGGIILVSVS